VGDKERLPAVRWVVWAVLVGIGRVLFAVLFHFEVDGREYIPRRGAFIIAANHRSFIDPPAIGIACPRRLRYVARESLFVNRWFSGLIRLVGAVPVRETGNPISSLRSGLRILESGQPLVIFPEGTRARGPELAPGRPGIGFLAVRSGRPVIPTLIVGSDRVLPRSAVMVRATKMRVRFGPPVLCTGGYGAASEKVMEAIRALEKT